MVSKGVSEGSLDVAGDEGALVEEAEGEVECWRQGVGGVWEGREDGWLGVEVLVTLLWLHTGDALADVVWPVVGMAGSIVREWFVALLGCSMGRELVGVDVEEMEVAVTEEGSAFWWRWWMEDRVQVLQEGCHAVV